MIITRTPLRISLGGGGTDLASYYSRAGHGFLIAAAITKYVYIAVNENFEKKILLKYSSVENCAEVNQVQHPIIRECLIYCNIENSLELSSMADIPTGTGLGSSGSFTVGVLKALQAFRHLNSSSAEVARDACLIEIEKLKEPVGKQDQYIAAYGGICGFTFHSDDSVVVEPLQLAPHVRLQIEENLLLFYTGVRRAASEVLAEERSGSKISQVALAENLNHTREIGYETRRVLEQGDLNSFGAILTEQWNLKFARQPSSVHETVNDWISKGIEAGALGGKLVGAGGGGFLLFYAEQKNELRIRMKELGLVEIPFGIDYEGSALLVSR